MKLKLDLVKKLVFGIKLMLVLLKKGHAYLHAPTTVSSAHDCADQVVWPAIGHNRINVLGKNCRFTGWGLIIVLYKIPSIFLLSSLNVMKLV